MKRCVFSDVGDEANPEVTQHPSQLVTVRSAGAVALGVCMMRFSCLSLLLLRGFRWYSVTLRNVISDDKVRATRLKKCGARRGDCSSLCLGDEQHVDKGITKVITTLTFLRFAGWPLMF